MPRRNPLELEKVLEKIISQLQDAGLLSQNIDHKELLENTMNHLRQIFGEKLPKGDILNDRMMIMKLTLAVMATHKNPANPAMKQIFELGTPQQNPHQLQQLIKDLNLDDKLELKLLKFMELCLQEKKENLIDNPDNTEDNKFPAVYDATGQLLEVLVGVIATNNLPGEKVQTKEEILSETGMAAENLKDSILSDLESLKSAPSLNFH